MYIGCDIHDVLHPGTFPPSVSGCGMVHGMDHSLIKREGKDIAITAFSKMVGYALKDSGKGSFSCKGSGLKLVYAINTHVHADHVTGSGLIKTKVPGVKSIIAKASKASADILVETGDKIQFGDLYLEGRATPGHNVGCVTYVTGDAADQPQPRMAFTGDAVLIRGCGRTNFQGGSSQQLYESVYSQARTRKLPTERWKN
uniref:Metallo-beta-lactamase domain-containing protein n=1 Tax=Lactuca sativa TaxID=4236 RepID=A0A9R1WMZ1_LACSA|nr:hypothetical protein LSAT_V11C100041300 [Lactuca sativa]